MGRTTMDKSLSSPSFPSSTPPTSTTPIPIPDQSVFDSTTRVFTEKKKQTQGRTPHYQPPSPPSKSPPVSRLFLKSNNYHHQLFTPNTANESLLLLDNNNNNNSLAPPTSGKRRAKSSPEPSLCMDSVLRFLLSNYDKWIWVINFIYIIRTYLL